MAPWLGVVFTLHLRPRPSPGSPYLLHAETFSTGHNMPAKTGVFTLHLHPHLSPLLWAPLCCVQRPS